MKIIVGCSLFILILFLIFSKIRASLLFLLLAVFYYVLGYLDLNTWLSSYTNHSLITLITLLLISLAIEKSILIELLSKLIISKNYIKTLIKLAFASAFASAFLNNTVVVASFMIAIKNNKFHPPSKLLLPLSYFAILGGTMTLIGTSTNLIIDSLSIENGLNGFMMFDFFYVGVLAFLFCLFVLLIFSKLLPNYKQENKSQNTHTINAKVLNNCSLIGKSIKDNELRNLEYLFLFEIQRDGYTINPVSKDEIILKDDILVFSGDIKHINILNKFKNLQIGKENTSKLKLVDVIISQESNLVGKTVKQSNFRTKFDASIISYKKRELNITKIGSTIIEVGDRLVLNIGKDFYNRDNLAKNFHLLSNINHINRLSKAKSLAVFFGFIFAICLSIFGILELFRSLLLLLLVLIGFKILSINEIKRQFPLDIFITLGSSLAITKVLINSNLANDLAYLIINTFGSYGVFASFVGVYIFTLFLTEIMTNNAAAALSFPIALSLANTLNVNASAFIFAVVYGASASFLFPHSYQTHLMVSSICGYKIKDFLKIGWIVSLVYSIVVIFSIPVFFNF